MKKRLKDLDLNEAFTALNDYQEDIIDNKIKFDLHDANDISELRAYMDEPEKEEIEMVVDLDAEDEDSLQDSYIGDILLQCNVCKKLIYRKDSDLIPTEDEEGNTVYNIDMECPECGCVGNGFTLIGKVDAYDPEKSQELQDEEDEVEEAPEGFEEGDSIEDGEHTDEEDLEESLTEAKEEESEDEEEVKESLNEAKDVALEDLDETLFDNLANDYLKEVYENVESYKTTDGSVDNVNNKLILEGTIKFKSGREQSTKFIFEADSMTKRGRVKFKGLNETFTKKNKAFTLQGRITEGKLLSETLQYNYLAKSLNESKRIYGRSVNKLTEGMVNITDAQEKSLEAIKDYVASEDFSGIPVEERAVKPEDIKNIKKVIKASKGDKEVDESLKESVELTEAWTDAYKEFEKLIDINDPDSVQGKVDALYAKHKGEEDWDKAYDRWCEHDPEEVDESLKEDKLVEANWNVTLKSGKDLRQAIKEEDYQAIIDNLVKCYEEAISKADEDQKEDLENALEDLKFSMYSDGESGELDRENIEDIEDTIDYYLDEFYDYCDAFRIWVGLEESCNKKHIKEDKCPKCGKNSCECDKELKEAVQGGFDSEEEAIKYWEENHDKDPVLKEYDDIRDWLKDSKENGFIGESLEESKTGLTGEEYFDEDVVGRNGMDFVKYFENLYPEDAGIIEFDNDECVVNVKPSDCDVDVDEEEFWDFFDEHYNEGKDIFFYNTTDHHFKVNKVAKDIHNSIAKIKKLAKKEFNSSKDESLDESIQQINITSDEGVADILTDADEIEIKAEDDKLTIEIENKDEEAPLLDDQSIDNEINNEFGNPETPAPEEQPVEMIAPLEGDEIVSDAEVGDEIGAEFNSIPEEPQPEITPEGEEADKNIELEDGIGAGGEEKPEDEEDK